MLVFSGEFTMQRVYRIWPVLAKQLAAVLDSYSNTIKIEVMQLIINTWGTYVHVKDELFEVLCPKTE